MEKKEEKTKEKQTKTKKRIKLVLKTILIITALVFSWRFYSLVRFEGRFTPWYVWGISNPYKYWQEHIGLKLIEHGKRYDLKPTIDENDPTTYNVYQNKKHHFRFKYPKGFDLEREESPSEDDDLDTGVVFSKRDNPQKIQCSIYVMYKGWGVGKNWLPRARLFVEYYIRKGNIPFYFITKNGQIVHTNNCGSSRLNLFKDKEALVDYVDKKSDRMYYVVAGGRGKECPIDFLVDVLTTFEFTP